ncbi:hypothetical protein PL1_1993 [Paenibacillus larvae subsp. larvae B-3650]|nr:hypothetical protein PL1_1993 [Paenibacillus larvae subsp. larvae B-3650]
MMVMIQVYPASSRFHADHGWLKTDFSFSFAEYYDPDNLFFGPMRVLNDDYIAGHKGFGMHPHREMEIVTIVLKGQLEHQDSLGNKAVTSFGEVQRMSAGSGIMHSEINPAAEEVNLLQMWFLPEEENLTPSYETSKFDPHKMVNTLLPVVSKHKFEHSARIHQDMTIYLSELKPDQAVDFVQEKGRRIFFFVLEGSVKLNGNTVLARRDSARITEEHELSIVSSEGAKFMLTDLP